MRSKLEPFWLPRWWHLAVVLVLLPCGAFADDAAKAIVRQALEALPKVSFAARLRLTTAGGPPRELDLKHRYRDGARSSYLEVVSPPDLAGIRFLFIHRIDRPPLQYVKVAASRRHVLVSDDARKQPFLDSAYYIADVIEPELDAFEYRIVGESDVQGRRCQFIEAVARDRASEIYGKTVVAIDSVDHLVLRREFYEANGDLSKVLTAEKIEKIDEIWTVRSQRMKSLKDGRISTLDAVRMEYNVDLPDEMFQPDYLLR